MKYYVYIIKSIKYEYTYVGHTENLKNRLAEHNKGKTKSNKSYMPFALVYFEEFGSRKEAIERERYFKSGSGREYVKRIMKNAPVVQLDRIPDFGSGG